VPQSYRSWADRGVGGKVMDHLAGIPVYKSQMGMTWVLDKGESPAR
jgi:hypothetical protein